MGKRYDWQVTPQNTPHYKERRLLFLAAMVCFMCNLIFVGIFLASDMLWYLIGAAVAALFAAVQCFDMRREMWTWGYVIFWIVFSFVASAVLILWFKAFWWLIGYGIELIAFTVFAVRSLKKRDVKSRRK